MGVPEKEPVADVARETLRFLPVFGNPQKILYPCPDRYGHEGAGEALPLPHHLLANRRERGKEGAATPDCVRMLGLVNCMAGLNHRADVPSKCWL